MGTITLAGQYIEVSDEAADAFTQLHWAATTLSYMHAALGGASETTHAHPAYRVLALSLLELYGEGTPSERMDKMSDVIAAHRHELW